MRLSNLLRSAEDKRTGGKTILFYCPGCKNTHAITIEGDYKKGPQWTFNGNVDNPTFSPSIKVTWSEPSDNPEEFDDKTKDISKCCHFFIIDGKFRYCGDCTHELNNKTVPMIEKWLED